MGVKDLIWKTRGGVHLITYTAYTPIDGVCYYIYTESGTVQIVKYRTAHIKSPTQDLTLEEAKALCQEHWKDRILRCLNLY